MNKVLLFYLGLVLFGLGAVLGIYYYHSYLILDCSYSIGHSVSFLNVSNFP